MPAPLTLKEIDRLGGRLESGIFAVAAVALLGHFVTSPLDVKSDG